MNIKARLRAFARQINQLIYEDTVRILGADKVLHIIASFAMVMMLTHIMDPILAFVVAGLVGLAKEGWDHYAGNGFCRKDLSANTAGGLIGLFTYACMMAAVETVTMINLMRTP